MTECLICAQSHADYATQVFADDDWAAGIISGYDVPGWIILRIKRHAVGLQGLNARELETFGRRARDVLSAVAHVTNAIATYAMSFGEAYPHYHLLITPRTEAVSADRRTGDILKLRQDHRDLAAATALIPAIRAAYLARAAEAVP